MPDTNLPASGTFQAPPADAPMERTQPLTADAGTIVDVHGVAHRPIDKARMNERELQPLTYGRAPGEAPSNVEITDVKTPGEAKAPEPVKAAAHQPVVQQRPVDPTRPAMSADEDPVTARPARGIPGTAFSPYRTKPALAVEGGFGSAEQEYFPLTGEELKQCVGLLLEELVEQIGNDLRFTLATTYPRFNVKVNLIVEAETEEQVRIEKIDAREVVPLEVAQQHCDSVVFVVSRSRREFDAHNEVETPVDALRQELEIPGMRKQTVPGPFGPMAIDLPTGF